MPATAMPNGGPSNQNLEGVYTAIYLILNGADPRLAQEFQTFVRQSEYVQDRYNPRFSAQPTQSYEEMLQEEQATQKWIDKVFEYVAPSLFVTSVLASGELVGSTIWGISKYVSKDIIWDTLGATTAAVILQSADLVGYKDEAQALFGIKTPEKRAGFALHLGGKAGKALGAVAGTALSLTVESFTVGLIAPPLVPLVTGVGLVIGGIVGEVVGAGLVSGLNNLFFSTIGTLPASYQGIKQKGGKFVDRLKHSREVKRLSRAQKAKQENRTPAQKANNAAVPGSGESVASPSVVSQAEAPHQNVQNNSPIPQRPDNVGTPERSLAVIDPKSKVLPGRDSDVRVRVHFPLKFVSQERQGGQLPENQESRKAIIVKGQQNNKTPHAEKSHNKSGGDRGATGRAPSTT